MKILFIYPNANRDILSWADTGAISEPLALEYLATIALEEKHDVKILDLRLHWEDLDTVLQSYRPDFIGITGYSMHVPRMIEIATIAKEYLPNCWVSVGGHHATLEPIDFQEPCIDSITCGEGTVPLRALLQKISDKRSEISIPGVYIRQTDGSFKYGGNPEPFEINKMPHPTRTLIPEDRSHYYIDWMKPIAMLRTSVGCPFRCSFCSLWRLMQGQYCIRNNDDVVQELAEIPEKYVFFVDDEPFINANRMFELAKKIKDSGIQKEYFSYCRIDSLHRNLDLLQTWKEVGLRRLIIGVETVFEDELKKYNKKYGRDQIVEALKNAHEIGIAVLCNFIVHPNYTEKRFDELIRFIEENKVDHPSFNIWTPLPGTNYEDYNILYRNPKNGRPAWEYFDLQHAVIETALPLKEFVRHFDGLYRRFIENYIKSKCPSHLEAMQAKNITLDDIERQKKYMENPYTALAARMLSIHKNKKK
jgi:radical SAM superfamily enzyme YgiQ (UPF0313 family)